MSAAVTKTPADIVKLIYEACNPSKVSEIPKLLEKYHGNEKQLIEKLVTKYGAQAQQITSQEMNPIGMPTSITLTTYDTVHTVRVKIFCQYMHYFPLQIDILFR